MISSAIIPCQSFVLSSRLRLTRKERMPQKTPMRDVIVLLPGITGSVLQKDGVDAWVISHQAICTALTNMSSTLAALEVNVPDPKPNELAGLIQNNPHALDDLGDGVRATRLMPNVHMIPGLWKIDGYSTTKQLILDHFKLTEGSIESDLDDSSPANFFEFPYDWRRDNRIAAYRLKHILGQKLQAWRDHSGATDAKLILIAHSMGGLVSRYYLEALEGWHDCKLLVTFGTPYRGSLDAVNYIVNGYKKLFVDFTKIVRSCPGVYQLLPDYQVINAVNGLTATQHRVDEITLPNLDRSRASDALGFHAEINAAVKQHLNDPAYRDGLHIEAIVGTHQPTSQSATLENNKLTMTQTILTPRYENFVDGDNRVAQISAVPPEHYKALNATYFAERHSSIQTNSNVLGHIIKLLEMTQIPNVPLRGIQDFRPIRRGAISVELDDLYAPDEPVIVRAHVVDGEPVQLEVRLQHSETQQSQTILLQGEHDTWQDATLEGLTPGLYRIQVRAVSGGFDAVHDIFEVAG
jgi:pimeloyl-ACP methyl ester carboxylesterase